MAARKLRRALEKAALSPDDADLDELLRLARQSERVVSALKRELLARKEEALIERDVLRAEIRADLVDREANAARVAERQRILFERSCALPGQLSSHDRAAASANYVETALASLCPNHGRLSSGCERLYGQ